MMEQTHVGYYYWQQPMGNTMPGVNRVQKNKIPLPGPMRIAMENSAGAWYAPFSLIFVSSTQLIAFPFARRPGDNSNDCAQGYSCPPPSLLTFDPYMPIASRYLQISLGGSGEFTWNITTTAPWIKLSSAKGSINRANPDTTVEVSIDWGHVPTSSVTGSITIYNTAPGFYMLGDNQLINVNANKTAVSNGYHGEFVPTPCPAGSC